MTYSSTAVQALSALGDPRRRAIFERLAGAPGPVGEVVAGLPITRSAVSQHLRVLREAGLVTDSPDGARRIYRLDPAGLGAIREWLDRRWDNALGSFADFADQQPDAEAAPDVNPREEQP